MEPKFIILIVLSLKIHTIHALNIIEAKYSLKSTTNGSICTTSGIRCHDCWTSLNCIDLGNDTFYPELQHCPIGKTCKTKTGTCESEGNYECSNVDKLKCFTEGVFPSPFNNMEYFTCVRGSDNTLLKFISNCNSLYEFDPAMKMCRRKTLDEDHYLSLVPVCQYKNQSRPIKNNPNIFYMCEMDEVDIGFNLIPRLYGCPFDFRFNGTNCVDTEHRILEKNGLCLGKGRFSHPTKCNYYYDCPSAGEMPGVQSCSSYQKFDQSREECVYFDCNNCNV